MSLATKKYLRLSKLEKKWLLITTLIFAFIFSFTKWGVTEFDVTMGLINLLIALIVVAFSLGAKLYLQKWFGIKFGFKVEFDHWKFGLFLGLILSFLSNGSFIFLATGGLLFSPIATLRTGFKGASYNNSTMGWIAALGPFTAIMLAVLSKVIESYTGWAVFVLMM